MKDTKHKLTIADLRKTYGQVVAVAGANLDIEKGEFVTLLGPSGSGKTTLLTMVAGLTWPDAGEVRIDDRLCTYLPSHQRDIGMVFQAYALFPHLTVFQNIAFPLRMRREPDRSIREKVGKALERVQLPQVADRLPSALSGGQQQRVALARCIVYEPSIILMDEPLGALDKRLRDQMQLEIKALHEQLGITVLYVTHDQDEAMVMSDRICLFNEGSIEQLGPPDELYFAPRTRFAASFLGESNIIETVVSGTGADSIQVRSGNGATLTVPRRFDVKESQSVSVMVRPESIQVGRAQVNGHNAVEGVLRDRIMTGGVTRYFVEVEGGHLFSATSLTSRGGSAAAPGDRISLVWPVEDTVMLGDQPD